MAEQTIKAHDRFPEKRILSHWIQPHYPFIGSDEFIEYKFKEESVWQDLKRGVLEQSDEDVYRAYRETLKLTLPYVSDVIDSIPGRVVVSSDHGNVFGVWKFPYPFKIYGHPRDVLIPELVDVPWVVFQNGDRRTITEEARERGEIDRGDIDERLSDLGYLQ